MIVASLALALGLLWLAHRAPSGFFLVVLASFAIGLPWLLEDHLSPARLELVVPAHKALLLIAVIAHALRYGLRLELHNWPVLAVALLLLQTMFLADLDPALAPRDVALAAFGLALPWVLVQMVPAPGARQLCAGVIMLLPLLCLAAGLLTDVLGLYPVHVDGVRLQGATNSGWLAFLAFIGFAVALHEMVRTARPSLACPAVLNLSLAILSGGRMGILACLVHAVIYGFAVRGKRAKLGRFVPAFALGGVVVAVVFVLYLPLLWDRMLRRGGAGIDLSGRGDIWSGYLRTFSESPVFGHGLGATATGSYFDLPHNEYLRLLVEGGAVGFALFAAAVVLWGRALLKRAPAIERPFIIALFAALALYATTDNLLLMSPAMVAFAYLGVVLSEQTPASALGLRPWRMPPKLARRGWASWQWLRRRCRVAGRSRAG